MRKRVLFWFGWIGGVRELVMKFFIVIFSVKSRCIGLEKTYREFTVTHSAETNSDLDFHLVLDLCSPLKNRLRQYPTV